MTRKRRRSRKLLRFWREVLAVSAELTGDTKESLSRDKGEIEAKLIRAFKNGLTPTEAAEKHKIPLKTVKEVWELYSDLKRDTM